LTGARQVGKTTLVRAAFPDIPLLRFDAQAERSAYGAMTPADWIARYPTAILDEVQKAPQIFETLKSCYDQEPKLRYLMLGSSQVQLMQGVRETLAGRIALLKLHALTLPELMDQGAALPTSPFQDLLRHPQEAREILQGLLDPVRALSEREARARRWFDHSLKWGGMPSLIAEGMTDSDRMDWLMDYQELYLQRDLGDLARLSDLEPFARAQKIAALRTGEPIQFAALGASAGIGAATARKYLQYLEISYQIVLLQPWFRNTEKRLTKSPKLHFLDNGVRRGILRRTGEVDGHEFEGVVVSEAIKQEALAHVGAGFFHLRTTEGREVDLLLELDRGYIALECKLGESVTDSDARHLRNLSGILDKPLLAGIVVSQDPRARRLTPGPDEVPLFAVPAWRLFG
jgi:predicted AAA+ superfamily ATPase